MEFPCLFSPIKINSMTLKNRIVMTAMEKDHEILPADSVVMAAGSRSVQGLESEITQLVPEIHTIGDAKEPRNALEAIKEGFLTGLRI